MLVQKNLKKSRKWLNWPWRWSKWPSLKAKCYQKIWFLMLPFELKITQKFVFKGHYPEMAKMTKSRTSNFILKTSIWWSYKNFLYPILHMKTGLLPVCRKYPTSENTTKFDHSDTLAYNPTRLDFLIIFGTNIWSFWSLLGRRYYSSVITNSTLLKNIVLPYQSLPLHFRTTKTIKKQYSQKNVGGRFKLGYGSGQRCKNQGYAVRWEGVLSFSRVKKPQVTSNHLQFFCFPDGHPQLFFFCFVVIKLTEGDH